ncbi:Panacea domain-containing protein [Bacillus methanolicus]|uniref:Panacea domain-containing protein n=1 Tax=Bacillus methanolicus TaxID=1471 RepID=UPI00200F7E1C|nr:type II toxin-antitoxin system antitoxin SocA domain-containing protein [Bacillus methanolicus]
MAKIYYFSKVRKMQQTIQATRVDIHDVAQAFLSLDKMTHKKLQKLCYYAYAWYYTLYGQKLFNNSFQAWVHGPVCPELYHKYKDYGWQEIDKVDIIPFAIENNPDIYEFIQEIYESYGHLNGDQLEYLTHMEDPWKEARGNLDDLEPCTTTIKDDVILRYYRRVLEDEQQD